MKKFSLSTLLLIAMMFFGASTLGAADMKCGASMKCGAAMKACPTTCKNPKCAHKLDPKKKCDCKTQGMKCGAAMKCGAKMQEAPAKKCGAKEQEAPAMKCGAGK